MTRFSAMLDACVLVPVTLADTLLRLAEASLYRPLWSARIITETVRAIEEYFAGKRPALGVVFQNPGPLYPLEQLLSRVVGQGQEVLLFVHVHPAWAMAQVVFIVSPEPVAGPFAECTY